MNATQANGTSALTFVPVSEDSGKQLSCRAENPLIAGSAIEDGWKLEVHYVPQLNLRLGSKLRHQHIQEGNDVFLECDIRASPWVTEIGWRFEGRDLASNASAGIIVSNQSLVLQKVDRRERGRYTCTATNGEGIGESNAVNLRVRFAPTCKPGQKTVYGAARQEAVRVSCELEADPAQDVAFRWRFNASQQMLGSTNVMSDGTRSWATVVPQTDDDYGALLCWGKNGIGIQREPCIFTLIQAVTEIARHVSAWLFPCPLASAQGWWRLFRWRLRKFVVSHRQFLRPLLAAGPPLLYHREDVLPCSPADAPAGAWWEPPDDLPSPRSRVVAGPLNRCLFDTWKNCVRANGQHERAGLCSEPRPDRSQG
ncbi:hypothetical protein HPB50_017355 [Hyalomma asiaticum]|uniref:Uncharacterized protein n=1 Tax=Hyalomma asiaticum TaxID=266040 RepID=A0ACB7S9W3_HYAAI|nr:hypothetical protein HPB50_017355 [Hyalomma asiaticum]